MADFQHSTPAPARRAFLGGAAAAALITAVPVALAAAEPDAGLAETFRRWKAAADAQTRALDRFYALEEARELPPIPEALFRRPADFRCFYGFIGSRHYERERLWYGDEHSIEYLRDAPLMSWVPGHVDDPDEVPLVQVPDQAARQRRDEILAAYDQWEADIAAVDERSGYAAAVAAKDAAREAVRALRYEIIATSATTLQGLRMKAEAALGSSCSTPAEWLAEIDEGYGSSEQIAATICVDLLAIVRTAA